MTEKSLVNFEDEKEIEAFLEQPSNKIGQLLTGLLKADKKDYLVSGSKLVQAWQRGNFFRQLGREISEYMEKGEIKEDYFSNPYSQQSLIELLKIIDEDNTDPIKFNAMKSIFLKGIKVGEEQEALAYEIMQIARRLTSNDILVLRACFEIINNELKNGLEDDILRKIASAADWLRIASQQLGHKLPALVELSEDNLIALKLISDRTLSDRSGISDSADFRLTSLGKTLCIFIIEFKWSI